MPHGAGPGKGRGAGRGTPRPEHAVAPAPVRTSGQRPGILPAFPEGPFEVDHGRALDSNLYVMPGGQASVHRAERARLLVTLVVAVVLASVAEVDPAHVGHVLVGTSPVPQHDQLLVVGAAGAHPHVQQAFPTGDLDLLAEEPVLPLVQLDRVEV